MRDVPNNVVAGPVDLDPLGQVRIGRVFGGLNLALAVLWACTMLASVVAAKASPDFFWVLLILICGASGSGACVEAARRRLAPR